MTALRILILSDGRAGHFNISEGIAAAVGRRCRTDVTRIEMRRGRWPGAVLAALVNANVSAPRLLKAVYRLDISNLPQVDLIVSAGAETLAANVALSRSMAVPNMFYGSLRFFRAQDFRLCLTSYERDVRHPNQAMALKPSRIDVDALPSISQSSDGHRAAGLLIGGDSSGIHFAGRDWDSLISFIRHGSESAGLTWLVTNSRRTPDHISDRFAQIAREEGSPIVRFIDVRDPTSGNLLDVFEAAEVLVCTADSSTMISEAVQLCRPVIGIEPEKFHLGLKEQSYRHYMERQGWVKSVALSTLTPDQFEGALGDVRPMSTNYLDELAELVMRRIPQLKKFSDSQ